MGAREVTCKSDFQVMVGQIKGEFEVKELLLQRYYHTVNTNIARFEKVTVEHICRENKRANALSRLSTTKKKSHHWSVMQIWLRQPSATETECLAVTEAEAQTWMTPIVRYHEHGTCKPKEGKAMKQQGSRYTMLN